MKFVVPLISGRKCFIILLNKEADIKAHAGADKKLSGIANLGIVELKDETALKLKYHKKTLQDLSFM